MRGKQRFSILLIAICILIGLSYNVWAETDVDEENDIRDVVVQERPSVMSFEITSQKQENYFIRKLNNFMGRFGDSLPARYKTENLTVKNQGTTGECWAFSFTSAFEAYNLKKTGKTDLYSPRHIDYSCSKSFTDVTDTQNLFNRETSESVGNALLASAYSASGKGPVLESDMIFSNDVTSKISYKDLDVEAKKRLDTSVLFNSIYKKYENGNIKYYADSGLTKELDSASVVNMRKKIKEQIRDNGGIIAFIYQGSLQDKDVCVKQEEARSNHAVLIVGWDDDYKTESWTNPGAYIVLNSYGMESFYDGYTYVSYDDVCVEQSLMGIAKTSDVDFDNVYEYDPFGATASVYSAGLVSENHTSYDLSEMSAINIFERNTGKPEVLKEVGVSTFSYQKAEVYFSDNFHEGTGLPINFRKVADLTDTLNPGFCVIPLNEEIILDKDKFAICVRFVEDNEENIATVAIEYKVSANKWWDNVSGVKGESYFVDKFDPTGINTYWSLKYTDSESNKEIYKNASIKAYTSEKEEEPDPVPDEKLVITSSVYSVDDEGRVITRIPAGDTVADFKSKINLNKEYVIIDNKNNVMSDGVIKTGYGVKVDDATYLISVIGDISGDGNVNIIDLARMRLFLIDEYPLASVYWHAADLSGNGKVDIIDLARMRLECLK